MADEKFKFNETLVKEKFGKIEAAVNAVAGKKNYNPFLWIGKEVQPLVDRFTKGERTEELQKAILAVPEAVPCLDPNWKEEKIPRVIQTPKGLILK